MTTAFAATTAADIVKDVDILTHDVSSSPVLFGINRGGLSFDPETTFTEIAYDGRRNKRVQGMMRKTETGGVISGTFIESSVANATAFEAGATVATASLVNTITPKAAGVLFVQGDYLSNLKWVQDRGDAGVETITFPLAVCLKYSEKTTDNGEKEISAEFGAVQTQADAIATPGKAAYTRVITKGA